MTKKRKYKVLQIYRNLDDMHEGRKLANPRWLSTYETFSTVRAIYEAVVEFDVPFSLLTTELIEESK